MVRKLVVKIIGSCVITTNEVHIPGQTCKPNGCTQAYSRGSPFRCVAIKHTAVTSANTAFSNNMGADGLRDVCTSAYI